MVCKFARFCLSNFLRRQIPNIEAENAVRRAGEYEFEDFRLDTAHLMLYRGDEEISLAPKVAQTLLILVERHGEILGKDELMKAIWNDSIVEEANLTQYIHILRKVLGAANGKPLIETLRRRGYRFNGKVRCVETEEKNLMDEISERSVFYSPSRMPVSNETAENKIRISSGKTAIGFSHKTIAVAGSLILLILTVSAFWNSRNKRAAAVFTNTPNVTLKRLTPDRNAIQPTLSPDGRYMVYATLEKNFSKTLRLRDLTNGSEAQIMPDDTQYMDFAFSSDGTQIYYLTSNPNSPNSPLERIPLFGGKPREVFKNVISPPAVSPDGKRIAVFTGNTGLTVIDENGELIRSIELLRPQFSQTAWNSQMSWSPDGERLAICGNDNEGQPRVLDFSVKDQTGEYLPMPDFNAVDDALWLADGSGLLLTAKEKAGEPFQIWRVAYPSGEAVRVTRDFNDYDWINLSSDSKMLVVGQNIVKSNIWSMPFDDFGNARQLTFGSGAQDGYRGTAFAPNGKIIFTSPRSGNVDLWQMNADGSEQQPLTNGEASLNISPRVTSDGRYIVFASSRGGSALHLWRIGTDGRNPLQLTNGTGERFFDVSRDGSRIYYATANDQKLMTTRRISIDGGESSAIADDYQSSGTIAASPDGRQFLRYVYLQNQDQSWRYGVFPTEGGEPSKLMEIAADRNLVRWAADGKSFLYIKPGTAQIWRQPIDGEPPALLLDLKNGRLFYFALSPDYKQIVFAHGEQFSEAVLIENFGN